MTIWINTPNKTSIGWGGARQGAKDTIGLETKRKVHGEWRQKKSVEIRRNLSEALKNATSLNDISIITINRTYCVAKAPCSVIMNALAIICGVCEESTYRNQPEGIICIEISCGLDN